MFISLSITVQPAHSSKTSMSTSLPPQKSLQNIKPLFNKVRVTFTHLSRIPPWKFGRAILAELDSARHKKAMKKKCHWGRARPRALRKYSRVDRFSSSRTPLSPLRAFSMPRRSLSNGRGRPHAARQQRVETDHTVGST